MADYLDDTDKKFGPDLPLLFNMYEIWSVDSRELLKLLPADGKF